MNKKVWIIDDDEDIRDVMSFILEDQGYEVEVWKDGQQAFEVLSALLPFRYPDLIIVDHLMPVMDGPTFITRLQQDLRKEARTIPLILCTAKSDGEIQTKGVMKLQKPLEVDDLHRAVAEILS